MSITLNYGDTNIYVPYDTAIRSEYIKDLVDGFGEEVIITIPDKYLNKTYNYVSCKSAFQHYISFLLSDNNGDSNSNIDDNKISIIRDKDKLKTCFDIYSYFVDDGYFKFLMQQLHDNWTHVFTFIYTNIDLGLQREIFLHVPYDMLPQEYINNKMFFGAWLDQNKNKVITLNTTTNYHCNVSFDIPPPLSTSDNSNYKVTIFHTIRNKPKMGFAKGEEVYSEDNNCVKELDTRKILEYNSGTNLIRESEHVMTSDDCCKQGILRAWYYNNNIYKPICQGEYERDMKQGLWKEWFYSDDDGKTTNNNNNNFIVLCECEYVDDKKHGLCREWFSDGKLACECNYVHGELHGKYKTWIHDDSNDQYKSLSDHDYVRGILVSTESLCVYPKSVVEYILTPDNGDFDRLMSKLIGTKR